MNKKFYSSIIGIAAVTGLPFAPIIPTESHYIMSYQTTVEAQDCGDKGLIATSTPIQQEKIIPCFTDLNGDGLITVGVSTTDQGDLFYYQIDEQDFEKMKGHDGSQFNPKKQYLDTLGNKFKASKAEAAIAYVTSTGSLASSVTTISYPLTVSVANNMLEVGSFNSGGDLLSTIDYNGTSMTLFKKQQSPSLGYYIHGYYLYNPDTGTNNVNITYSSVTTVRSVAMLHSGVSSSGPNVTAANTATASTSVQSNITTTSDNSWVVMFAYSDGGSLWGSTGATTRNVQANAFGGFDNGPNTPAGVVSMTATSTLGDWAVVMAAFPEPSTPSTNTGQFIIFD